MKVLWKLSDLVIVARLCWDLTTLHSETGKGQRIQALFELMVRSWGSGRVLCKIRAGKRSLAICIFNIKQSGVLWPVALLHFVSGTLVFIRFLEIIQIIWMPTWNFAFYGHVWSLNVTQKLSSLALEVGIHKTILITLLPTLSQSSCLSLPEVAP
jgi:hypothetical protein